MLLEQEYVLNSMILFLSNKGLLKFSTKITIKKPEEEFSCAKLIFNQKKIKKILGIIHSIIYWRNIIKRHRVVGHRERERKKNLWQINRYVLFDREIQRSMKSR